MSRRRGEFEHRTSIFEGAFRAWSHLGGLEPLELESKSAADLDPLTNPLENDARLKGSDNKKKKDKGGDDNNGKTSPVDENEELNNENDNDSGDNKDSEDKDNKGNGNENDSVTNDSSNISPGESSKRRIYPYEPLPRSGLSHPFVQAILSPWLGPDADQDAIQLGLTTLRTWWQHRRKGESGTAIGALGTEKMRGVVEGYTRHFFNLAHCLVTNDGEQPPRTLMAKMRNLEKFRAKKNKKKKGTPGNPADGDEQTNSGDQMSPFGMNNNNSGGGGASVAYSDGNFEDQDQDAADMEESNNDANLSPLERLHAAQRRQLAESGGVSFSKKANIDMTGKCIPGKINIPGVVEKVQAAHLAHRGNTSMNKTTSQYGDPNRTPVVFVSHNGDIQIAMSIDGITCAHCVKIVETVLRGCNGNKSPIAGLLDAAADRALNAVLIKIDQSSNAKRIAFEAARNLSMVGYTAKAKEIDIVNMQQQNGRKVDLSLLSTAWDVVANTEPTDVFNWSIPCSCPDNGVLRQDCARHSQMNKCIFEAFEVRESRITEFIAGCAKKFGLPCNCGANCKCSTKCADKNQHMEPSSQQTQQQSEQHMSQDPYNHTQQVHSSHQAALHQQMMALHHQQQQQLGMGLGANGVNASTSAAAAQQILMQSAGYPNSMASVGMSPSVAAFAQAAPGMAVQRHSFSSWGTTGRMGRNMSITSENTFGRAMSGLSALSIDWENMEDFDVNVDHSAHINNGDYSNAAIAATAARIPKDDDGIMHGCAMLTGGECNCGPNCLCSGCPIHDKPGPMPQYHHIIPGVMGRRRSSLKKNIPVDPDAEQNMQVSFKVP